MIKRMLRILRSQQGLQKKETAKQSRLFGRWRTMGALLRELVLGVDDFQLLFDIHLDRIPIEVAECLHEHITQLVQIGHTVRVTTSPPQENNGLIGYLSFLYRGKPECQIGLRIIEEFGTKKRLVFEQLPYYAFQ